MHGIGAAISASIFTLAAWEVSMVIAKRWQEREREKAREEGRQKADAEWQAWLERMREAQKEGREFNEPAPSERSNGQR